MALSNRYNASVTNVLFWNSVWPAIISISVQLTYYYFLCGLILLLWEATIQKWLIWPDSQESIAIQPLSMYLLFSNDGNRILCNSLTVKPIVLLKNIGNIGRLAAVAAVSLNSSTVINHP